MRKRKSYEGICPIACKKYRTALAAISKVQETNRKLNNQCKKLDSLCDIARDNQLLAVEKKDDAVFVTVMEQIASAGVNPYTSTRRIYMYELPFWRKENWRVFMDIEFCANCKAYIIDCHANPKGSGYGTMFMKQLISFLRSIGIRSLTGIISPTDFAREQKLRRFYGRFGFEITDYPDKRYLHLDLFDEKIPTLGKNGAIVCCRSAGYQLLKSEVLLAETGNE